MSVSHFSMRNGTKQDPTQLVLQLLKGKGPKNHLNPKEHQQINVYTDVIQGGGQEPSQEGSRLIRFSLMVLALES